MMWFVCRPFQCYERGMLRDLSSNPFFSKELGKKSSVIAIMPSCTYIDIQELVVVGLLELQRLSKLPQPQEKPESLILFR